MASEPSLYLEVRMDVGALKEFNIFNGLDESEIKLFADKVSPVKVPEGDSFIVEGDVVAGEIGRAHV